MPWEELRLEEEKSELASYVSMACLHACLYPAIEDTGFQWDGLTSQWTYGVFSLCSAAKSSMSVRLLGTRPRYRPGILCKHWTAWM